MDILDRSAEVARVSHSNWRAKLAGLPATLTIDEWMETLVLFKGVCAYCRSVPFEILDHLLRITAGGGTTQRNCVPACAACHGYKSRRISADASEGIPPLEATRRFYASLRPPTEERGQFPPLTMYLADTLVERVKQKAEQVEVIPICVRKETHRKLKLLAAFLDESMLDTLDRLISEELEGVQKGKPYPLREHFP